MSSSPIRTYFSGAVMNNIQKSTELEFLLAGDNGAYAASTICGCNSRKYHGLLVAPQPQIDDELYVLLSTLDESVFSDDAQWQLGTHRYPGVFYPEGYLFISEFSASPAPCWHYRFGNFILRKELVFAGTKNILLIRYTLLESTGNIKLRLQPLLAFRNMHTLSKANAQANTSVTEISGGISIKLYDAFTPLFLQFSENTTFVPAPDWYYNMEYREEQKRGYDFHEDLCTPGYFEVNMKKGQSVIIAAGYSKKQQVVSNALFERALNDRRKPATIKAYLLNAARQFLFETDQGSFIKAGYYWFGSWGRDTCISLPGLTLVNGDVLRFKKVVNTLLAQLKNGLIPNMGSGAHAVYNTADASLWLIWALQEYVHYYKTGKEVWQNYGAQLRSILMHYKQGTEYGIRMEADGLIFAGVEGYALTWMDAMIDNRPVTPRTGKAVELNALWYNAVCFCLELAQENEDFAFINEWESYPEQIRASFLLCFWDNGKQYLADYVCGDHKDWSVRPNQLFAVSLPYSPLPEAQQRAVMYIVTKELFTPRGLRTLSTGDSHYCGHYSGDQHMRDNAYHQGTVWPWLLGHFADASLKVFKKAAMPLLEKILSGISPALQECCLYSIAEICDGDYPHKAGGAVAQAWSVAELLRLENLVNRNKTISNFKTIA